MLVHVNKDFKTVTFSDNGNRVRVPNIEEVSVVTQENNYGESVYRIAVWFDADTVVFE